MAVSANQRHRSTSTDSWTGCLPYRVRASSRRRSGPPDSAGAVSGPGPREQLYIPRLESFASSARHIRQGVHRGCRAGQRSQLRRRRAGRDGAGLRRCETRHPSARCLAPPVQLTRCLAAAQPGPNRPPVPLPPCGSAIYRSSGTTLPDSAAAESAPRADPCVYNPLIYCNTTSGVSAASGLLGKPDSTRSLLGVRI